MALTSLLQDFEVRQGLIVLGTSTVTTSTGNTGTLQVDGGAAIAKNFIVGGTSDLWGTATVHNNLIVEKPAQFTDNTQATTLGAGAVQITGGAYVGNNLVVKGTAQSTTTVASNALYVDGGLGVKGSLLVDGDAVFTKDVVFAGTTTYVYSTNTVYTDNFIDLHVPSDSSLVWSVDDGKDIGLIFNYYNSADKNGFLGLKNSSKYLEWFSDGTETSGTLTSGVYGMFKTGGIVLTNATQSTGTTTGALTVTGGIGAQGRISGEYLSANNLTYQRVVLVGEGGVLTDDEGLTYNTVTNVLSVSIGGNAASSDSATNLLGGSAGALPYQAATSSTTFLPIGPSGYLLISNGSVPTWATTGSVAAGFASSATNLIGGAAYQIPYQTSGGSTGFSSDLLWNYDQSRFRTVKGIFQSDEPTGSTATGALVVQGGIGVNGGLYVGSDTTFVANVAINGGTLSSTSATFNLVNTPTTVNFAEAATALTVGATSGYTTIRNSTTVTSVTEASSTDTAALVVYGGVGIGKDLRVNGSTYIVGDETITGDLAVNGGDLTTTAATFNLVNANATTVSFAGAGTTITIGAPTGQTEIRNATLISNSTNSIGTNSGALVVAGGVGINENLFVKGFADIEGDLAVNGGDFTTNATTFNLLNTTATTVNFAGAGTAITIGSLTGHTEIRNATTITNSTNSVGTDSGALVVAGGVGINERLYVGGNAQIGGDLEVKGGDLYTDQVQFNLLDTNITSVVNFAGSATQLTIGSAWSGFTQIRNLTTVTNTTDATTTTNGAFTVRGGASVSKSLFVGEGLNVFGPTTLKELRSTVTTATNLTVSGPATISGIVSLTNTSNAVATNDGALRVSGGVGIVKDVVIGGQVTAGTVDAATTGSVVNALFSNVMQLATFQSTSIAGTSQQSLDHWSSTVYRSARYFIQIHDGSNVHVSEISVFHDGTKAYLNEYGIATNNGQLGAFDATLGGGEVTIKFTPIGATDMTIKMVRMGITA